MKIVYTDQIPKKKPQRKERKLGSRQALLVEFYSMSEQVMIIEDLEKVKPVQIALRNAAKSLGYEIKTMTLSDSSLALIKVEPC